MKKIESLTPEQQSRLSEFAEIWTKIGLCTDPADRPRAEAAINQAYHSAGLKPPQKIVWCGSPLTAGMTRAIILDENLLKDLGASVWDSVGASVGASVWDSVGDSVRASVGDSVGASVRDSVGASGGASVWDSVRASVGASVGDSVGASVGDSVWDSIGASVRASVGDSVGASAYGQHDASWLGFYEFFRIVCGLTDQTEKLTGLIEQAKSAGWFLPHANICWVSERHNILARDERGSLHSVSGPACAYPDGWSIYAVHGVRVPADIIEDRPSITIARIDAEQNSEIRRVMMELYGYDRYILDSGSEPIHADDYGTLYRKSVKDDEDIVMVSVINSTPEGHYEETGEYGLTSIDAEDRDDDDILTVEGRVLSKATRFVPDLDESGKIVKKIYWLRCHPELRPLPPGDWDADRKRVYLDKQKPQMMTAHNAIASTFGLRGEQYNPQVQT